MKFRYVYKTSDGVRREGKIDAPTREDVFATLRTQKIRAIKVIACDGSKDNGADYGVRTQVVVTIAIVVALAAAGITGALFYAHDTASSFDHKTDETTRRQPIGDAVVIEKGIRTGWADVFDKPGDRFLASFAIPGVPASIRTTTIVELQKALAEDCVAREDDTLEVRQIKSMVAGIKEEIREYLADGGKLSDYCTRLVQRQETEIAYHQRIKTELETAAQKHIPKDELEELWEKRNETLRGMGIKLVPMPESETNR